MLIIASFDGRISMELRHLATFRTLATTLNFTQTAALLGYVQSDALIGMPVSRFSLFLQQKPPS
jgi:hypothetical protein